MFLASRTRRICLPWFTYNIATKLLPVSLFETETGNSKKENHYMVALFRRRRGAIQQLTFCCLHSLHALNVGGFVFPRCRGASRWDWLEGGSSSDSSLLTGPSRVLFLFKSPESFACSISEKLCVFGNSHETCEYRNGMQAGVLRLRVFDKPENFHMLMRVPSNKALLHN